MEGGKVSVYKPPSKHCPLHLDPEPYRHGLWEAERLLDAADIVTRARTAVDIDYRGNVVDAHAPEMPTRFAKQLGQVVPGAVALGVPRRDALRLAIRCARDSIPPLRRIIIDDLAKNPESTASDVRKRTGKPW